ncbi:MAG: hypothetical protein QOI87_874 [Bradyrhizobium sp.]|jgi:hypothetical protein|nr:hypothetical protein [Bradyrhizobium sp.]
MIRAPRWGGRIDDLHGSKSHRHGHYLLLPPEQNTFRYSIAASYLAEARIRPHRLLKYLLFVCFAEAPTTTLARGWDDGARHR